MRLCTVEAQLWIEFWLLEEVLVEEGMGAELQRSHSRSTLSGLVL